MVLIFEQLKKSRQIREIISFLKANALHTGHSLIPRNRKKDQTNELYEAFLAGEIEETKGLTPQSERKLRSRFLDNLTTSILSIDPNRLELASFSKQYYLCTWKLSAAKILRLRALHRPAMMFVENVYKVSKRYSFYDIQHDCLKYLKEHHGTRVMKEKLFKSYNEELQRVKAVLEIEEKALDHYSEMVLQNAKPKASVEEKILLCENAIQDLNPYIQQCDNYFFQLFFRLIRLNRYSLMNEFEYMLNYSSADVDYYLSRKPINVAHLYIFAIQNVTASIRLGAYEQGLSTIQQTESLIDARNVNWFVMRYKAFFIYMQSGQYEKAMRVYLQCTRHKYFKNITAYMREEWEVGAAYLSYVIELGYLSSVSSFEFRFERFLKSVPAHSADKRTKNIPVLVVQILYLLLRKNNKADIEDRMEAIEKYCARNLRDNPAVRSNAFIQILLQIPKAKYSKQGVLRRIGKFKQRLEEIPLHQSGKAYDLELIPYERLAKYVLTTLK